MTTIVEKFKRFIFARQYQYRKTFHSPPGEAVLKDLAKFCRANTTTFHADARLHAVAEGRREVWLRIANNLNMSPDELWALYSGADDVPQ